MSQKQLLFEVSIIRPLAIFLLVVYHSMCIYTGAWEVPVGSEYNLVYDVVGQLITGFRIETLAFIGGYDLAFQFIFKQQKVALLKFIIFFINL